jgi:hypothetical protein
MGNLSTYLLIIRGYCDSTPETLVTNYKQQIAAQRFKAIPTVTKNPLLHPTQQRRR